jgi:hypothetical protein
MNQNAWLQSAKDTFGGYLYCPSVPKYKMSLYGLSSKKEGLNDGEWAPSCWFIVTLKV